MITINHSIMNSMIQDINLVITKTKITGQEHGRTIPDLEGLTTRNRHLLLHNLKMIMNHLEEISITMIVMIIKIRVIMIIIVHSVMMITNHGSLMGANMKMNRIIILNHLRMQV